MRICEHKRVYSSRFICETTLLLDHNLMAADMHNQINHTWITSILQVSPELGVIFRLATSATAQLANRKLIYKTWRSENGTASLQLSTTRGILPRRSNPRSLKYTYTMGRNDRWKYSAHSSLVIRMTKSTGGTPCVDPAQTIHVLTCCRISKPIPISKRFMVSAVTGFVRTSEKCPWCLL